MSIVGRKQWTNRDVQRTKGDRIGVRNRRYFSLRGSTRGSCDRHLRWSFRGVPQGCQDGGRRRPWTAKIIHMFRVPMAQLVDTNRLCSATLTRSTEFPRFAICVNARNSKIHRFDILPSGKGRLLTLISRSAGSRACSIHWCMNRTVAHELITLAAVTLTAVERRRSCS